MLKKLLVLFFIFFSTVTFSQKKSIDRISVSPNPFSNTTTLKFQNNNNNENLVFLVKNVLGKIVYKKKYKLKKGNNKIIFSRGDLNAGMYIYSFQTSDRVITKRFVIK